MTMFHKVDMTGFITDAGNDHVLGVRFTHPVTPLDRVALLAAINFWNTSKLILPSETAAETEMAAVILKEDDTAELEAETARKRKRPRLSEAMAKAETSEAVAEVCRQEAVDVLNERLRLRRRALARVKDPTLFRQIQGQIDRISRELEAISPSEAPQL